MSVLVGCVQDFRRCVQDLVGPPLRRTSPPPDRPTFRSFLPLPPPFSFFLLSLGGLLVEFWWCVKPAQKVEMLSASA